MKTKQLISFPMLFAGLLFLCNPNINLFDILPDAVGYFLIAAALRGAADILPHFDSAHRGFMRLAWINVAKIPAILAVMAVFVASANERSIITVFSFAFAVLEIIFALPAFKEFFAGFIYLGERDGAEITLRDEKGASVDRLSFFTMIFVVVKTLMSFLPELALLSVFGTLGSLDPGAIDPMRFYPFFLVAALIIGTVIGVMWLTRTKRYLKHITADGSLQELFVQKSQTFRARLEYAIGNRYRNISLFLLLLSVIFAIDIILNDQNYLPDLISAALFFVFFFWQKTETPYAKKGLIAASFYFFFSVAETIMAAVFFSKFEYTDVAFLPEKAGILYLFVEIAVVLATLSLLFVILLSGAVLTDYMKKHMGPAHQDTPKIHQMYEREINRKIRTYTVLGILTALFHAAEAFLLTVTDRYVVPPEEANQYYAAGDVIYSSRFGGTWIVALFLTGIWIAYTLHLYSVCKEETDIRYKNEALE